MRLSDDQVSAGRREGEAGEETGVAGGESAGAGAAAPWRPGRVTNAVLVLARLAPSGRSLAVAIGLLAATVLAYAAARQTSLFAVRSIEVRGAPAAVSARVRAELAPTRGTSLLAVSRSEIEERLAALPGVVSADYDRAFPHTLRIFVRAERPVAVLRRGAESWLVSARGRLLRRLPRGARPLLPRLWLSGETALASGGVVSDREVRRALGALAPLAGRRSPRVRFVRFGEGELTFVLRSYTELRLGDARQVRLKLAVARRVLRVLARSGVASAAYVDLGVPRRPVVGELPSS